MWTLTDEDGWSLTLTDENGLNIGFLKATTDEQKANARRIAVAPEAVALLERMVREEEMRYEKEYRAAVAHNNTGGVGVSFDYAPLPTHPEWFDEAREIIARAKGGEQ